MQHTKERGRSTHSNAPRKGGGAVGEGTGAFGAQNFSKHSGVNGEPTRGEIRSGTDGIIRGRDLYGLYTKYGLASHFVRFCLKNFGFMLVL